MTRSDLINSVAAKTGMTKKDSTAAVCAVFEAMTEGLTVDEKVSIVGFATLSVKEKAERRGVNPLTGEPIVIPARKAIKFAPAKVLKESIN